jgi:hypothetical protein
MSVLLSMDTLRHPGNLAHMGQLLALAAAYVVLGKLGLTMNPVAGFASLVWPATGISIAALMIGGSRSKRRSWGGQRDGLQEDVPRDTV